MAIRIKSPQISFPHSFKSPITIIVDQFDDGAVKPPDRIPADQEAGIAHVLLLAKCLALRMTM